MKPLWLESDEHLVALVGAGSTTAFETLDRRYRLRLLAFCRQILRSESDAEDVLQETFAAAYKAMRTDRGPLHVRPWLYQIARNRCLNHIRGASLARANPTLDGAAWVEAQEAQGAGGGSSAADVVIRQEGFRLLVEDVLGLAEAQRTALVLHEIHGLSYHDVAQAMGTSVAGVKSLLVRARDSLAHAADARDLPCDHAQRELSEEAKGLRRSSARVRWHLKRCSGCLAFKARMKEAGRRVAAISPVGPIAALKGLVLGKLSSSAATSAGASAAADGSAGAAIATKAAIGLATVAALTTGAAGIERATRDRPAGAVARVQRAVPAVDRQPPTTGGVRASEDGGEGHSPVPAPAGERPPTPPPAGEIESSTPDVVPQGITPSEPKRQVREPSPGTTARGRPSPGSSTERRTRPVPDSLDQTEIEALPPPPPPVAPKAEPPPSSQGSPVVSNPPAVPAPEPPAP